ncbi:MAG: penicillin-binding transpeptidase domain-containing protein [bacterium]|nr:penicillin-binding transpeptidase domain-containing protein [bacterium]
MRHIKQEFNLEDSMQAQRSRAFSVLDFPLSRRVFILFFSVSILFSIIVGTRVGFFSVTEGNFYTARAELNAGRVTAIPARRGIIYDRFGKSLVENEPAFSVAINITRAKKHGDDIYVLAEKIGAVLDIEAGSMIEKILSADIEQSPSVTIAENIDPSDLIGLRGLGIDAIEINDDYRRHYIGGPAFSHVIGYTGLTQFNDAKGKTGLEAYYDDVLRGQDGSRVTYVDAMGNRIDEKLLIDALPGSHIYTTIDADLQEYTYQRLRTVLHNLGRAVGVGIALDPRSGEVLSLVNVPSYDNNIFTNFNMRKERSQLLQAPFQPLFNRALSGLYTPGSVIKPLVAFAALKEGIVDTKKQIFSSGVMEIPNPYNPDAPSRFLDWKAHGLVDIHSALARSSNIYFYAVGGGIPQGVHDVLPMKGLGIATLKSYWDAFGFGHVTGIDLAGEESGFLPDPEEKESRTNDIWRLGDTYNVSIGQGDFLTTPLQVISYIASFAAGGTGHRPYIVQRAADDSGSEIFKQIPEISYDFSTFPDAITEVRHGMEDAVSKWYGTANSLADLPMRVAGKTGSAQVLNNTQTNAFFVGYAPVENPEIAILVLIENAREGSLNAVPVGKDILNWYYWNRLQKVAVSMQ